MSGFTKLTVHVFPAEDTRPHVLSLGCWCHPERVEKHDGYIVTHTSDLEDEDVDWLTELETN